MELIKEQENSNGKEKIIFSIYDITAPHPHVNYKEFGICILSQDKQIDFDFDDSELEQLISFLKACRKSIKK